MDSIETRQQIRELLLGFYPEGGAHAKDHAAKTEELVDSISNAPEYAKVIDENDRTILRAAALAHDIGYYLGRKEYWSAIQWEHPYESAKLSDELLQLPFFAEGPERIVIVKFLILNHDNTNYLFPAYRRLEARVRDGFPEIFGVGNLIPGMWFLTKDSEDIIEKYYFNKDWQEKFYAMWQILREADSRLGDAKRTIDFSISRQIPITADDGGMPGIGMLMWQYSGLANIILAAKRALLDAYTKEGQEIAWGMFLQSRKFAEEKINEEMQRQFGYLSPDFDNVGELLRREDVEAFIWRSAPNDRFRPDVRISQAFPLENLKYLIDYKGLKSRLISVSKIHGPRLTVDRRSLRVLENIREALIKNYAIDILTETSGALRVITDETTDGKFDSREHQLIPPIIDRHGCLLKKQSSSWVVLAEELGLPKMRVLVKG